MPVQGIPTSLERIDHLDQRKRTLTDPADVEKVQVFVEHLMAEHAYDRDATMASTPDTGYPGRGAAAPSSKPSKSTAPT